MQLTPRLGAAFGFATLAAISGCGLFQDPVLRDSPLVFTEVHFAPSAEQGAGAGEFIEVGNRSDQVVDASDWRIAGAGECTFRRGTKIAPGEVVVACKVEETIQKVSNGAAVVAATFLGKLRNEGETLTLIDSRGRVADQVTYAPSIPGVADAIETGKSLQRPKGATKWSVAPASPGRW
ncbi:MAG: lamin tail domain-containing protein [Planctomycetota bacterium]